MATLPPRDKRVSPNDHISVPGNPPHNPHTFAAALVADALRLLAGTDPQRLIEVRALNVEVWDWRGSHVESTHSGIYYADEIDLITREVAALGGRCTGIYLLLNPISHEPRRRELRDRRNRPEVVNDWPAQTARVRRACGISRMGRVRLATADEEIAYYDRLPLDLDPIRPPEHVNDPATDAERAAAFERWAVLAEYLSARGFPRPTVTSTGNGVQPVYRIEPLAWNDDLIPRLLDALHERFTTDRVKVDASVSNAARIVRLAGTMNRKGTATDARPHRRAEIVQAGEDRAVTREQVEELLRELPAPTHTRTSSRASGGKVSVYVGGVTMTPEVEAAARAVCERAPISVQGGDAAGVSGSARLLAVTRKLAAGLLLSDPDLYYCLRTYFSSRCAPPWSDGELSHAVDSLSRQTSVIPAGCLLPGAKKWYERRARVELTAAEEAVFARLCASQPSAPVSAPANQTADLSDLSGEPFCSTTGKFGCSSLTSNGRCGCGDAPLIPIPKSAKRCDSQDGTGSSSNTNTVEEEPVPTPLLNALIGQSNGEYCNRAKQEGLDGYSADAAYGAIVLLRCRCWSECAACREYDRYSTKRDNLPLVARLATHIFKGTAEEWDNTRMRLAKAKVKLATFAVGDGHTRTTIIAVDPDSPPIPDALVDVRRVSHIEAVTAAALAVDSLPDRVTKGVRKFSPSHTWKLLLERGTWKRTRQAVADEKAKAAALKEMTPEERDQHQRAEQLAKEQAVLDKGGIVWHRKETKPVCTIDEALAILNRDGVEGIERHALKGDNALDSVMWEVPIEPEKIERLRKAMYESTLVFPVGSKIAAECETPNAIPW